MSKRAHIGEPRHEPAESTETLLDALALSLARWAAARDYEASRNKSRTRKRRNGDEKDSR